MRRRRPGEQSHPGFSYPTLVAAALLLSACEAPTRTAPAAHRLPATPDRLARKWGSGVHPGVGRRPTKSAEGAKKPFSPLFF